MQTTTSKRPTSTDVSPADRVRWALTVLPLMGCPVTGEDIDAVTYGFAAGPPCVCGIDNGHDGYDACRQGCSDRCQVCN